MNIINVDSKPTVTVSATDSSATEGGDTGTYRISRTGGNAASALSVYYTMSETATCGGGPGGDYTLPGGCGGPATMAANVTYVDVTLTAVRDNVAEGSETAIMPETITAWGSKLATVFTNYGDGNGLWIYEGSSWKKATDWLPSKVISWKGDAQLATVFTDYGSGNGLWSYDGSSWKKLTDWVPLDVTKLGTDEIAAVFDEYSIQGGNGIWKYNFTSQSWQWVTDWVPAAVSSSGDYLNGVFDDYGSGNGVWKYRNGNWTRLTDWTSNKPKP